MDGTHGQVRRFVPGLVMLALGASGCSYGIPAPPFPEPVESAPLERVIEYATRIDYDTAPGAGDEQPLMLLVGGQPTYGPLARIEPARKAFESSLDQLAKGRIVARMINLGDQPYPKLNLGPRDTTYLWVDNPSGDAWRFFYASRDSLRRSGGGRMSYHRELRRAPGSLQASLARDEGYAEWKQSIARWVWDPNDEKAWVTCSRWGCCEAN